MNRPIPSYAEMQEVKRRCEHAEAVAYTISANGVLVKYANNSVENATIVMASHEYDKIKAFELESGRYFSLAESEAGYNLGIIGSEIATQLFDGRDPIGKTILVRNGTKVKVIGVFKREGEGMMGNSSDDQVLVPVNFARKLINVRSDNFQPQIQVKATAGVSNEELTDELRGIMRNVHRLHPREEEDFALNEAKMISQQMEGLFQGIGFAGWIIGGFSILVGGFGIAIQKSLGAKNYFILLQFLVESVVLCMIGGSVGLLLILLGTLMINAFLDMHVYLTLANTILGLSVSAIIGIIAGFLPAWSASRMDPVDAIRTK
jgi:putative ABC transport system permease protein